MINLVELKERFRCVFFLFLKHPETWNICMISRYTVKDIYFQCMNLISASLYIHSYMYEMMLLSKLVLRTNTVVIANDCFIFSQIEQLSSIGGSDIKDAVFKMMKR